VENYNQHLPFLACASSATAGLRSLLKERTLEAGSTGDWINLERQCWYPWV